MSTPEELLALGDEPFVVLTTFKRFAEPVATRVWVARDGDALVVIAPRRTAKIKRLRRDPLVELRPCDRHGRVPAGAPVVRGVAVVRTDPAAVAHVTGLVRRKYGRSFRIAMLRARVLARRRRDPVCLVITHDDYAHPSGPT